MLVTRFLGRDRDVAVADGLRVLQALDWTAGLGDPGAPAILTYLPDARANPYQSLLYCRLHESGIRPVPGYDVHAATRLAHALQGGPHLVVHLHWLNIVTAKVADEAAAVEQVNVFVSHLRGMVDVGARLVWTVHNVLPHDSRFPEVDALLRREVVALLDRLGFAPSPDARVSVVKLRRCPLLEAAHKNPEVVCGVHLGVVRGALDELGADPEQTELTALEPFSEPGACRLDLLPRRATAR